MSMATPGQHRTWIFGTSLRVAAAGLALAIMFVLLLGASEAVRAGHPARRREALTLGLFCSRGMRRQTAALPMPVTLESHYGAAPTDWACNLAAVSGFASSR
jgi:hypothetical protein